jgi:hypothetical protein
MNTKTEEQIKTAYKMTDEEDYPSDEQLEFIKSYKFTFNKEGNVNNYQELLDYVHDIWWCPDWGWTKEMIDADLIPDKNITPIKVLRLRLSTGGWSGNEDIIQALRENEWFWTFFWQEERRGGHYVFEFKINKEV